MSILQIELPEDQLDRLEEVIRSTDLTTISRNDARFCIYLITYYKMYSISHKPLSEQQVVKYLLDHHPKLVMAASFTPDGKTVKAELIKRQADQIADKHLFKSRVDVSRQVYREVIRMSMGQLFKWDEMANKGDTWAGKNFNDLVKVLADILPGFKVPAQSHVLVEDHTKRPPTEAEIAQMVAWREEMAQLERAKLKELPALAPGDLDGDFDTP